MGDIRADGTLAYGAVIGSNVGPKEVVALLEITAEIRAMRSKWRYRGGSRPHFSVQPGPGQESVWDYPRPPEISLDSRCLDVSYDGRKIARSASTKKVVETAGAPTFYFASGDVDTDCLVSSNRTSVCEWKGLAVSVDLIAGPKDVGWRYIDTFPEFTEIGGFYAFYPGKLDCRIDGETALPQGGGYYGGWITSDLVGPFKGDPGTSGL